MWKRRIEETVQFEFVKQDHLHWTSWNSKYYYHCHARTQQRENHSWTKAHRTSLWPNYPLLHIRFSFLFHKTAKQLKSFKKYILKEKLKFAEWEILNGHGFLNNKIYQNPTQIFGSFGSINFETVFVNPTIDVQKVRQIRWDFTLENPWIAAYNIFIFGFGSVKLGHN